MYVRSTLSVLKSLNYLCHFFFNFTPFHFFFSHFISQPMAKEKVQKPVNLPASRSLVKKPYKPEVTPARRGRKPASKPGTSTSAMKTEKPDTSSKSSSDTSSKSSSDTSSKSSSDDEQKKETSTHRKTGSPEFEDTYHEPEATEEQKETSAVDKECLPEFPPVVVS